MNSAGTLELTPPAPESARRATQESCPIMIPHSRPYLGDDLETVAREIGMSGLIGPGREVNRFETQMMLLHDAAGAVATSSGTAALHLALLGLGIGPGDEVIIPSYVCTALLNAIRQVGAQAVLAEVDEQTFNIDPVDVSRRISGSTKAIIAPHMFGQPADVTVLKSFGIPIIEDCAQALGATIGDSLAGSLGDVAIFSFYATKVVTTGEGGMAIAKDSALIERLRDLRDYDEKDDYIPRFNYRMSDLAAGTGCRQLMRLPDFIGRRRDIAQYYSERLRDTGFALPYLDSGSIHFRYVVRTENADHYINALRSEGIQAKRPVYAPLHHYIGGEFPRTDETYRTALSLPLYPALTDSEAEQVMDTVLRISSDLSGQRTSPIGSLVAP